MASRVVEGSPVSRRFLNLTERTRKRASNELADAVRPGTHLLCRKDSPQPGTRLSVFPAGQFAQIATAVLISLKRS
ncbi:hypothetical protein CC2G_002051 [Coprinopsis cinerea AmutBmut pab1-1]|nr:hypothetical protein CC2G_002051 [Coprinopsis cinerea AmutBmut pab1-1]